MLAVKRLSAPAAPKEAVRLPAPMRPRVTLQRLQFLACIAPASRGTLQKKPSNSACAASFLCLCLPAVCKIPLGTRAGERILRKPAAKRLRALAERPRLIERLIARKEPPGCFPSAPAKAPGFRRSALPAAPFFFGASAIRRAPSIASARPRANPPAALPGSMGAEIPAMFFVFPQYDFCKLLSFFFHALRLRQKRQILLPRAEQRLCKAITVGLPGNTGKMPRAAARPPEKATAGLPAVPAALPVFAPADPDTSSGPAAAASASAPARDLLKKRSRKSFSPRRRS